MNKKVTIISSIALLLGLSVQLTPVFQSLPYQWMVSTLYILRTITPNLNLSFGTNYFFTFLNFHTGLEMNFLDLSIYAVMLLGLILYLDSKGSKTGVLRMSFAIILLSKSLEILYFTISLFSKNPFNKDLSDILFPGITMLCSISWWYFAYLSLQILSGKVSLQIKTINNTTPSENFIDSPKYQRLIHHFIDSLLSIIICTKFFAYLFPVILTQIGNVFGKAVPIYIVGIFSKIMYLLFFESAFSSTPAKFLTASRIITGNGQQIQFKKAILRTLIRFVPFEALSFLDKSYGWHDKWTNTRVVKERSSLF